MVQIVVRAADARDAIRRAFFDIPERLMRIKRYNACGLSHWLEVRRAFLYAESLEFVTQ
jgi:hypothetical protein